jgi:hypothetical protein
MCMGRCIEQHVCRFCMHVWCINLSLFLCKSFLFKCTVVYFTGKYRLYLHLFHNLVVKIHGMHMDHQSVYRSIRYDGKL